MATTIGLAAGCRNEPGIAVATPRANDAGTETIPVILDADIGDDVDDTWALLMLLRMPQLDLKLAGRDGLERSAHV